MQIHFSISLSETVVKFFEKYLWWSAVFSKFACNALQHWTTAAEKLHFITALINAEQQLMQNTSKKLLLCLETVVCRCSSKYLFLKINFYRKATVLESVFNKIAGLQVCNFVKKRLQHRCYLVKFAKYIRTLFFT